MAKDKHDEHRALIARIDEALDTEQDQAVFSEVFREGCFLAGIHCDRSAADVFDVPEPIARRWRKGEIVPPGARVVLGLLREELERDIVEKKTSGTCIGCGVIYRLHSNGTIVDHDSMDTHHPCEGAHKAPREARKGAKSCTPPCPTCQSRPCFCKLTDLAQASMDETARLASRRVVAPKPETIRVRASVVVNGDGDWCVAGMSTADDQSQADFASECMDHLQPKNPGEFIYRIEADLLVPDIQTVKVDKVEEG